MRLFMLSESVNSGHGLRHNKGQPVSISLVAAGCRREESTLNCFRHGPSLPAVNKRSINFANGRDFSCRPRKECFIRLQKITQRNASYVNFVSEIPSNLN